MQRLIVGAGKFQRQEGWQTLDMRPFEGIDHVHDLNITPYPFDDNSFLAVSAKHVVEHLKDLILFMNECHRILAPGGTLYIETPEAGSDFDLTHCDPTHVRCYRLHTFVNYFMPEGIGNFGYTDKAWNFIYTGKRDNCLIIHGNPIK